MKCRECPLPFVRKHHDSGIMTVGIIYPFYAQTQPSGSRSDACETEAIPKGSSVSYFYDRH
jgi:hypothetical protein